MSSPNRRGNGKGARRPPREQKRSYTCKTCGKSGHGSNHCPKNKPKRNYSCKECGESGHGSNHCPKNKPKRTYTCRTCGESGHGSNHCPTNKQSMFAFGLWDSDEDNDLVPETMRGVERRQVQQRQTSVGNGASNTKSPSFNKTGIPRVQVCHKCTLENKPNAETCVACLTPLPGGADRTPRTPRSNLYAGEGSSEVQTSSSLAREQDSGEVECVVCSYLNKDTAEICILCNTSLVSQEAPCTPENGELPEPADSKISSRNSRDDDHSYEKKHSAEYSSPYARGAWGERVKAPIHKSEELFAGTVVTRTVTEVGNVLLGIQFDDGRFETDYELYEVRPLDDNSWLTHRFFTEKLFAGNDSDSADSRSLAAYLSSPVHLSHSKALTREKIDEQMVADILKACGCASDAIAVLQSIFVADKRGYEQSDAKAMVDRVHAHPFVQIEQRLSTMIGGLPIKSELRDIARKAMNEQALKAVLDLHESKSGTSESNTRAERDFPQDGTVLELSDANFDSYVANSQEPWMIKFYSESPKCKAMESSFTAAASDLGGRVRFAQVDVSTQRALCRKFSINDVPAIVSFDQPASAKNSPPMKFSASPIKMNIVAHAQKLVVPMALPGFRPHHIILTGNPGTGKTSWAHIIGWALHILGLSASAKVIVVSNGGDLQGRVAEWMQKAKGGVLFVDEVYALKDSQSITEMLPWLQEHPVCSVVIAGYEAETAEFLDANPGMRRRFRQHFRLPDYTVEELVQIFEVHCQKRRYVIAKPAQFRLTFAMLLSFVTKSKLRNGNGGVVVKILDRAHDIAMKSFPPQMLYNNPKLARTIHTRHVVQAMVEAKYVQKQVGESALDGSKKSDALKTYAVDQMSKIIGHASIKRDVLQFVDQVNSVRRDAEMFSEMQTGSSGGNSRPSKGVQDQPWHVVLTGNPGTGKSYWAECLAHIFATCGIASDNVVTVRTGSDLCGSVVGEAAEKVEKVVKDVDGGCVIIDEAYTMLGGSGNESQDLSSTSGANSYGRQAINTIMGHMSPPSCVFVFAGYRRPMDDFLKANPGLESRIAYRFHLEDYTVDELYDILESMLKNEHYTWDNRSFKAHVSSTLREASQSAQLNARHMKSLVRQITLQKTNDTAEMSNFERKRVRLRLTANDIRRACSKKGFLRDMGCGKSTKAWLEQQLAQLVGMDDVKRVFRQLLTKQQVYAEKRKLNLDSGTKQFYNVVISGPTGSGKTTVARLASALLKRLGVVSSDRFVEVSSISSLCSSFVAGSQKLVEKKAQEAKNGVLFIDEVGSLIGSHGMSGGSVAKDVVTAIMDHMSRKTCVFIFAGYPGSCHDFVHKYDEGFSRRIGFTFNLSHASPEALAGATYVRLSKSAVNRIDTYSFPSDKPLCVESKTGTTASYPYLLDVFRNCHSSILAKHNFGLAKRYVQSVIDCRDMRVHSIPYRDEGRRELLMTLTYEDFEMARVQLQKPPVTEQPRTSFGESKAASFQLLNSPNLQQDTENLSTRTRQDNKKTVEELECMSSSENSFEAFAKSQGIRFEGKTIEESIAIFEDLLRNQPELKRLQDSMQRAGSSASSTQLVQQHLTSLQHAMLELRQAEEEARELLRREAEEIQRLAKEEAERVRLELEAQKLREHEIRRQMEAARERERLRLEQVALEKKKLEERREQAMQQALRQLGVCVAGYKWRAVNGGYRCSAGGHFVPKSRVAAEADRIFKKNK